MLCSSGSLSDGSSLSSSLEFVGNICSPRGCLAVESQDSSNILSSIHDHWAWSEILHALTFPKPLPYFLKNRVYSLTGKGWTLAIIERTPSV